MKDEIKEILSLLNSSSWSNEAKQIEDYITNLQEELKYQKQAEQEYNEKHTKLMKKYKELQEENKRLKELDENYPIEEQLEEALKENKRLKRLAGKDYTELNVAEMNATIYKSRINKAIEYIEKCLDSEDIYEQFLSTGETKKVLKMLEGEDKDVKD